MLELLHVLSSGSSRFSLIPHWPVLSNRGSINVPSIFCCVQFYIFFFQIRFKHSCLLREGNKDRAS